MQDRAEKGKQDSKAGEPGDILQAKDVAAWLACHVSTVYDMFEKGTLKGFCLGRAEKGKRGRKGLRILASSVREFISSQMGPTAPAVVEQEEPVEPETVLLTKPPAARSRLSRPSGSLVALPPP